MKEYKLTLVDLKAIEDRNAFVEGRSQQGMILTICRGFGDRNTIFFIIVLILNVHLERIIELEGPTREIFRVSHLPILQPRIRAKSAGNLEASKGNDIWGPFTPFARRTNAIRAIELEGELAGDLFVRGHCLVF